MSIKIQTQPVFGRTRNLHMVVIDGNGKSGIAQILLLSGYNISGSDQSRSEATERLEKLGATIFYNHHPSYIDDADVVVYTSAVSAEENIETREALRRKIQVIKRS